VNQVNGRLGEVIGNSSGKNATATNLLIKRISAWKYSGGDVTGRSHFPGVGGGGGGGVCGVGGGFSPVMSRKVGFSLGVGGTKTRR